MRLLEEAQELINRSRAALAEMPEQTPQQKHTTHNPRKETTNVEINGVTPQRAGDLYTSGMSVIEVARETNISYSQARKLIKENGTPIRDASARLKGRTRRSKAGS